MGSAVVAVAPAAVAPEDRGEPRISMWWLRPQRFARAFDAARVRRAIEEAEAKTSGEIVVSIAPFFLGSVDSAARRTFSRLGMARTRERNGVLLFVVPARRQLYLLGDQDVSHRVGEKFWEHAARDVSARLANGETTSALIFAVARIGEELARHYPAVVSANGVRDNQLSDQPDGYT
jgi:uncharacterized membrane protein